MAQFCSRILKTYAPPTSETLFLLYAQLSLVNRCLKYDVANKHTILHEVGLLSLDTDEQSIDMVAMGNRAVMFHK